MYASRFRAFGSRLMLWGSVENSPFYPSFSVASVLNACGLQSSPTSGGLRTCCFVWSVLSQFGVGFYSSFVVSDRVEVFTRSREGGKVLRWCSDGSGTFSLSSAPADSLSSSSGTKIVCHLKQDCLEFANPHRVKECAKKFSAFVK